MLLQKLQTKAENKYPIYTRKSPCPCCKVYADCPSRVKNKEKQRETYIAWWLLKYRKRYERMYGSAVGDYSNDPVIKKRAEEAKAFIDKHGLPESFSLLNKKRT